MAGGCRSRCGPPSSWSSSSACSGGAVKFSRGVRLALAAVLLLTLGVKLVALREAPAPDAALFVAQAEAVLGREGFTTARVVRPFGTVVLGSRGPCRILVGDY